MLNNKFFILIALVALPATVFAQLSIGQIGSDSDAVKFVRQQNYSKDAPQWNHFYLTGGTEWKNYFNLSLEQENAIAQSLPQQAWTICDINNDGKADLLVSGYIARTEGDISTATYKMLVFLSGQKKNKYDIIDLLTEESAKAPAYFSSIDINNKKYVKLFLFGKQNVSPQMPLQTDTLQYNAFVQNFVGYAGSLYPSVIQKIEYMVKDDGQGSYHRVTLEKNSDKCFIIFSVKQADAGKPETHTLKIKESYFQSLDSLVRTYHFTGDEITIPDADNPEAEPITTTVYYQDGTKRTVKDFDGAANYTLMAIYQTMESSMQMAINKLNNRSEFWGELIGGIAGGIF